MKHGGQQRGVIIVLYGHPGGLGYDLPLPNILTCFEGDGRVSLGNVDHIQSDG